MTRVVDLLKEMRGRVAVYVGTTSLTKLAAFLRGYDYALYKQGVDDVNRFFGGFQNWLHDRFHTTTHSWDNTILAHSKDEADAVDRFWNLLDEYLQTQDGAPESKATATTRGR
jgi:hypothetical protein